MKVMKRKVKTGSSLLYVVILTAMLITFGTAVFALTVTDYKMRISEGNKIKNLYSAESGVEEAYGKLSNLLFLAVESGQKAIKESDDAKTAKENFKASYKDTVEKNIKATLESEYISQNGYSPNVTIMTPEEHLKFKNDKMSVVIQSSFVDKSNLRKIVESTFNIAVPEYEGVTSSSSATVPVKPAWSKAIVAGKNLALRGKITIDGGAYIEGKTTDKNKGIILYDRSDVDIISGDIITFEDIRLRGLDSRLNVKESNVFTDTLSIDKGMDGSKIDIKGKVYANNDLSLSANKSHIKISDGFYGINDKTSLETFEEDSKKSSSIYVNNDDLGNGSSISIDKEAIIMGTAYIKTTPNYQTGESVAIKGNYMVYGEGLDGGESGGKSLDEDNILFKYKDPLQLADEFKDGSSLNFRDKSEYINQYIKEHPDDVKINYGKGISLPGNTINVGGIFTNGEFKASNYKLDDEGERVKQAKSEYDKAVSSIDLDKDIMFENIKPIYRDQNNEVLILDNSGKPLNISGKNSQQVSGEGYIIDASKAIKGVIITTGDVIIRGKVDFTGTIISKGNIIFEEDNVRNVNYDRNYVQSVIGANYELFKDILSSSPDSVVVKPDNTTSLVNAVDTKSLIDIKNWKLIK